MFFLGRHWLDISINEDIDHLPLFIFYVFSGLTMRYKESVLLSLNDRAAEGQFKLLPTKSEMTCITKAIALYSQGHKVFFEK